MDPRVEANRRNWDDRARVHPGTDYYDVEGFLAGGTSLLPLERRELGDVAGKRLLHLQCHFGLDTLSWARLGAEATGADISEVAVAEARDLAGRAGLDARFVASDIYALEEALADELESFDVVVSTWGVLCWLPDVPRWARIAAAFLRPGGTLFLADSHPLADAVETLAADGSAEIRYPYLHRDEPDRFDDGRTFADPDVRIEHAENFQWTHDLGEVVTALADAGLRIVSLRELPWTMFPRYDGMWKDEEGRWWLPEGYPEVPLAYAVKARKGD